MKIKTLVIACGLLVLGACANGAPQQVEASVDSGLRVVGSNYTSITSHIYSTEVVDTETGVHYLIISSSGIDGGIGITPMYNADGTLKQY